MPQFRRLAVSLDLSSMDQLLVRYASFLADRLPLERIYFIHSVEIDPSSEWLPDYLPKGVDSLETLILQDMKERIEQTFDLKFSGNIEYTLLQGDPTESILEYSQQEEIDVLLMGKKSRLRGNGVYTGKIVRLTHSAVWLVPESAPLRLENIVAPVDFSAYSAAALMTARKIGLMAHANVKALHVTHLPTTYFPFVPLPNKIQKQLSDKAGKQYQRWSKELKLTSAPPLSVLPSEGSCVADRVYEFALDHQSDLMVLGSKGKTNASSFLLGGVAEQLALQDHHIPLLVVKDQQKHASVLERWFG